MLARATALEAVDRQHDYEDCDAGPFVKGRQAGKQYGKAEAFPFHRQQNREGRYNRHDQTENEFFYAAEVERRFEAVNYNCGQTIKATNRQV